MIKEGDTIVARATPAGLGGVAVLRISGPLVTSIAACVVGALPKPRHAVLSDFLEADRTVLDQGIAIYYPAPHSYTGEDVLELQTHGSPIIVNALIEHCVGLGARIAEAGEFTLRAFLNQKIDLIQAEAVSSLIHAQTKAASKSALKSMQGHFSKEIQQLQQELLDLRVLVEATLDFPEEGMAWIENQGVRPRLEHLKTHLSEILRRAHCGQVLTEGLKVVILGKPNAGKSSFLNRLAGSDSAIVSELPGTTRDLIRETIDWEGLLIHLVDTAGLRDSTDPIEQEGIRRAWAAVEGADYVFVLEDATEGVAADSNWAKLKDFKVPIIKIFNKIDLLNLAPRIQDHTEQEGPLQAEVWLSCKRGWGFSEFRAFFGRKFGFQSIGEEGIWSARTRHLEALKQVLSCVQEALSHVASYPELLAEALRLAQEHLNLLSGVRTADDLLGAIFSTFCIGK